MLDEDERNQPACLLPCSLKASCATVVFTLKTLILLRLHRLPTVDLEIKTCGNVAGRSVSSPIISRAARQEKKKQTYRSPQKIYTAVYVNYLPVKAAVHDDSELFNLLFMIIYKQPNRFYRGISFKGRLFFHHKHTV